MNYKRIHDQIIERAKLENRKKCEGVYYERHHIVPRCMGGGDEKENLVNLTAREHFIVHKLLHYIHPRNRKLFHAFRMMAIMKCSTDQQRDYDISSREYEYIKNNLKKYYDYTIPIKAYETKKRNGKLQCSEETKQKIREKRKLQIIKHSPETKKKIGDAVKASGSKPMLGKHHSAETRKKMSDSATGRKFYKIQCPNCMYIGGVNNMYKWHFDNCKHKK